MLSIARKIQPMWTRPWRVVKWLLNLYKLETLEGEPLKGEYSARRLREFILREETELVAEQEAFKAALKEKDQDKGVKGELTSTVEADEHRGEASNEGDDIKMDQEEGEPVEEELEEQRG